MGSSRDCRTQGFLTHPKTILDRGRDLAPPKDRSISASLAGMMSGGRHPRPLKAVTCFPGARLALIQGNKDIHTATRLAAVRTEAGFPRPRGLKTSTTSRRPDGTSSGIW